MKRATRTLYPWIDTLPKETQSAALRLCRAFHSIGMKPNERLIREKLRKEHPQAYQRNSK